ncbi:hypothetical protein [Parerythrobacter lacustris]|uniref:DUF883 family protein n=1 Tax=Parerythrobacter lacustris TaxID=2969984 RepID=A0ABT1XQK7_9SPHN|nr:hypothetical protein [Parerythrobacter lacustris]MCR2833938.1 hypothetical protein [Parerythrobacter lacustris]
MTDQAKRDELRAKIEAGEQRNADRTMGDYARDASEKATAFVKEHPLAAVAGVAAVGLAIGAMTRPGRRAARTAGRKTSAFASYAAELGMAYASGLFDAASGAAKSGGEKLEDFGEDMAHKARSARRTASHSAGDAADNLRVIGRKAARQAGRTLRDARSRIGK